MKNIISATASIRTLIKFGTSCDHQGNFRLNCWLSQGRRGSPKKSYFQVLCWL